jgi:hypothetical protein
MWQTIITGIIVAAALGITVYKLVKYFTNPLKKCGGCAMNCSGCGLEELKKEIELKKKSR